MPVISFICFLILLFLLISGLRKNADFLSPGRVFGILWVFVLGLVELKLSRLQLQWSLYDWLIVLIGLLTFVIGVYISYIINLDKTFLSVSEIRIKIREKQVNEKFLFRFIIFYFFFICSLVCSRMAN